MEERVGATGYFGPGLLPPLHSFLVFGPIKNFQEFHEECRICRQLGVQCPRFVLADIHSRHQLPVSRSPHLGLIRIPATAGRLSISGP